ncbi:phenol soluble modulin beta 1 family protein, partial [Staphylococcus capitis VCU116]
MHVGGVFVEHISKLGEAIANTVSASQSGDHAE